VRPEAERSGAASRFNMLLTEERLHLGEEHWAVQLPRLLRPQGVVSYVAHTGREAMDLAGRMEFHAVVVDIATPVDQASSGRRQGLWLMDLFHRMPNRPPMVVISSPAYGQRDLQRLLSESLRLGAFSVLNKPISLEQLLAVFRRLLERQYRGQWPGKKTVERDEDSGA
jgi:CheY-like chemotaxis protein